MTQLGGEVEGEGGFSLAIPMSFSSLSGTTQYYFTSHTNSENLPYFLVTCQPELPAVQKSRFSEHVILEQAQSLKAVKVRTKNLVPGQLLGQPGH